MPSPANDPFGNSLPDELKAILSGRPGELLPPEQEAELIARFLDNAPPHLIQAVFLSQREREREGQENVEALREQLSGLKGVLEELEQVPWHPATVVHKVDSSQGLRFLVHNGSSAMLVGLHQDFPAESVKIGDEVFINRTRQLIMAGSPRGSGRSGSTATVENRVGTDRLLLQDGGQQFLATLAAGVNQTAFEAGDLVRWNREAELVFEKIEQQKSDEFLLKDIPKLSLDQVGGQEANLAELVALMSGILLDPEKAARYAISGKNSILMVGPPGCGKTLMARVAASEISRISGRAVKFAVIKPGQFANPYVGVTEQRIRGCFSDFRKASEEGHLVVVFFDEVESVARTRGSAVGHHSDRSLAALLAEIEGFTDRGQACIICASNRKDLIDEAFYTRISDFEITVDRPSLQGARDIFDIHFSESCLYNPNGNAATKTRRDIIETTVSRIFSPNGDNELCTLRFDDGKTRAVRASELGSGRLFEQISRHARFRAFNRDMAGGEPGVTVQDAEIAVQSALGKLATTLSPRNVHSLLPDIPQDRAVVEVIPCRRKSARQYEYITLDLEANSND